MPPKTDSFKKVIFMSTFLFITITGCATTESEIIEDDRVAVIVESKEDKKGNSKIESVDGEYYCPSVDYSLPLIFIFGL
jgi:hypothetical protein